jgi:DNA-binding transcriptional ArsR family regulator
MEILRRIRNKECSGAAYCNNVLEGMEISQSTFSHHISELAGTGLITVTSQGRFSHLSVNEETWADFKANLDSALFG